MAQDRDIAQDKDERVTASVRRTGEADDKKTTATGRTAPRMSTNGGTGAGVLAQRRQQYLIALRPLGPALSGFQPQSIDAVVDYLKRQEDVEIIARVKPAGVQPFAPDGGFTQEIVVARIAEAKAESLRAAAQPHIIVERNGPLNFAGGGATPMWSSNGLGLLS